MIPLLLAILPLPDLVQNPGISELLASNQDGLVDEDGDASDWIEIHNSGAVDVDLGGYYLTDDVNDLMRWSVTSWGPHSSMTTTTSPRTTTSTGIRTGTRNG